MTHSRSTSLTEPELPLKQPNAQKPADPLVDLAAIRLNGEQLIGVSAEKILLTVPIRKPTKQEFVRVRPGPSWTFPAALLEVRDENQTFIISQNIINAHASDVKIAELRLAVNRAGAYFLWPLILPPVDGRTNLWHVSAREAAALAEQKWVRLTANMAAGIYDVFAATGELGEPEWPAGMTLEDLLRIAFRDRIIDDLLHPVLCRLRGEV
jgi:hypothetical protein